MVRSTLYPCFDVTGGQRYESRPLRKGCELKRVFSRLLRIQEVSSKRDRHLWETILELLTVQVSAQLEFMRPGLSHFTVRIMRSCCRKCHFFEIFEILRNDFRSIPGPQKWAKESLQKPTLGAGRSAKHSPSS